LQPAIEKRVVLKKQAEKNKINVWRIQKTVIFAARLRKTVTIIEYSFFVNLMQKR
jgi:hypothetical protein